MSIEIKTFGDKITGKSKLNLKDFFHRLDTNLKYHLASIVLNYIGIKVNIQEKEVQLGNVENLTSYMKWLIEKDNYNRSLGENIKRVIETNRVEKVH